MVNKPLVSFIVVAYNQATYIEDTIRGALDQTYSPLEIILSDDNSPDDTFLIMQKIAAQYSGPHTIILNQNKSNLGMGGHLNRCMEISNGEFITINAGDDISLANRTEVLVNRWLSENRKVKSLCSDCLKMKEDGTLYSKIEFVHEAKYKSTKLALLSNANVIGASHGWDREIFEFFGPLNDNVIHEDIVLPIRASLLGKVERVKERLLQHRDGGISDSYCKVKQLPLRDVLYGPAVIKYKRFSQDYEQIIKDLHTASSLFDTKDLIAIAKRQQAEFTMRAEFGEKQFTPIRVLLRTLWKVKLVTILKVFVKYQFSWLYGLYLFCKTRLS